MKIAIFHNIPGGGGYRMVSKVNSWLSRQHDVTMFSLKNTQNDNEWRTKISPGKEKSVTIQSYSGLVTNLVWTLWKLPTIHQKIAEEINKYDLAIVSHDYLTKAPYILRYLDIKAIYLLQEPPREFYEDMSWHTTSLKTRIANYIRTPLKFIDKNLVKRANVILSNSKYSQRRIQEIYGRNSTVVYPGVDTEKFKRIKTIKKNNQILSIGGIKKLKGHEFVVKSLKPILKDLTLTIVGDGSDDYKKKILNMAGKNRHNVNILDHVSEDKMVELYNESKVLCIGSYYEPFGLTSIEAQACGTPVVGVREGGLIENIDHGITGYISTRDNAEFRNLTLKAINNYKKLGRNGQKAALKWKWDNTLKILHKIVQ